MDILLVGLGNMGLKYLRKLEEMGVGIFINDINEEKAEGIPYTFLHNIEDIPESITHAIIAIDPKDHVKVASLLLEKGLKVLLEKPPALSSEEFKAIKDKENLFISEIELYNPCLLNVKDELPRGERVVSRRLNKGIGYFSPLWDLAWHDLYILDYLFGEVKIENCEANGFYRRLEGVAGNTPFIIEVAWNYKGNTERNLRVCDYLIDFTKGYVYKGHSRVCSNDKDKLKLMVTSFIYGTYIGGSRERADRIIGELEKVNDFALD